MSDWLRLAVVFLAAVNPAAVALAAWAPSRPRARAAEAGVTGLAVAAALVLAAALGANRLLDALEVCLNGLVRGNLAITNAAGQGGG